MPARKILNSGFTFLELIVTITLVAIISLVMLTFLNPIKQLQKSWDSKRKTELESLHKVFEDFYNDKNRYPLPTDVCFDTASSSRIDIYGKTACFCQICGRNSNSPSFSPYIAELPCDPQSPQKEYLYDYDCSSVNPNWFRIYSKLSITDDPDSERVGCGAGCGPSPDFAYDYSVFSGNQPEAIFCVNYTRLYQKGSNNLCNICKSPSGSDVCDYNKDIYYEVSCTKRCGQ